MSMLPQLPLALLPPEDRCAVVQTYLSRLEDRTLQLVCHLYSRGFRDKDICATLHLRKRALDTLKETIRRGIVAILNGD